ncbi:MAG: PspC domain-containing protein [Spirochaetota bacterium]
MKTNQSTQRKRLYRSRDGIIWGVCQGLANWLEIPVGIVRGICILSFILSGFLPIAGLYAAAAVLLPLEPARGFSSRYYNTEHDWDRRFYR